MQTHTHLAIGAAIGAVFLPHELWPQMACLAGSCIPDAPMVLLFGIDKILKRPPMMTQGPLWIFAKNLAQDLWIWLAILVWGFSEHVASGSARSIVPIALGLTGVVHVVVDRYSHGDPVFQQNDGSYTCPFGTWRRVGWDYRIKAGQLWPLKPAEEVVFWSAWAIALFSWI